MGVDDSDPGAIRSVAVAAEDVVAAVESHHQRDERVVLRVTPPFSGRMRARIHAPAGGDAAETGAVHLDPTALLEPGAPPYPRPADTEDELRADPDVEYTVERHHERHREALERWRDRLPEYVTDRATLETSAGPVTVDVAVLG
ncbi:MAG: hypothetical protein ABEJ30_08065 [Halorientalis sp.]